MSYRDDLSAARTRIRQLDQALADANRRIEELEKPKKRADEQRGTRRDPTRPRQVMGKIYFQRPWSYVPLLVLVYVGFLGAWSMRPKRPSSDKLVAWVLHYALVVPFFFLFFLPLFYLLLVPYTVVLAVTLTPVALLWMVVSGLKVASGPRRLRTKAPDWARKPRDAAASIMIAALSTLPVLAPIAAIVASC